MYQNDHKQIFSANIFLAYVKHIKSEVDLFYGILMAQIQIFFHYLLSCFTWSLIFFLVYDPLS